VYEHLDEGGIEVHLAHPVYVKPFAKKHVKTDKVDARVLAQLLRMDYLPESYVPGKEIRDQRVMIRHHASLVRLRTSIKNRVHALLAIEGIQTSKFSDLFGKRGMEFLKGVKLRQERREALDNYLEVLKAVEERIEEMEAILKERAKITDEAKWLMSIPGIGYHNALLILSELGEIEQFSNPRSMVSYSGLALKVEQSGDYTRYASPVRA